MEATTLTKYGICQLCGKQKKYNGPDCLESLAALARYRIHNRDWFYMPWVGIQGSFKSSTGLLFMEMVQPGFDVWRQVIRSSSEYKVARRVSPPGTILMVDEALKAGKDKMSFMSVDNKKMVQDFNTGRKLGHAVLDLTPFMDDLDPRQVKHAHWTIHMTGKGEGTAYEVRRIGFKKTAIWEEPRFTFEEDHCAVKRPDLWRRYEEKVMPDERGVVDQTLAIEERVRGHEADARRMLL